MFALLLTLSVVGQTPSWKQVDELISQQKYEAAAAAAEKRLAAARTAGDDADLAKALVRVTTLRLALGGFETAVNRLKKEAWPKRDPHRAVVELFYAASLRQYRQQYAWEIGQREKVDTKGEVDLKAWTSDQIVDEAQRTWDATWARREALGAMPIGAVAEHLTANDYPAGVRDTLRDAVTYLRVESLRDTSTWTAQHSNSVYQLDQKALVAGDPAASKALRLADPGVHPLLRIMALLDDVEAWHQAAGRKEAALFARATRLSVLHASFTAEDERARLEVELQARIDAAAALPFSAWARAVLAEWLRDRGELVRARDMAAAGAKAFPASVGGRRCAHLVAALEAPAYSMRSMKVDGLAKRSVEVSAKNLRKLYFRAWRVEPSRVLGGRQGYGPMLDGDSMRALLGTPATRAWAVELPATPDLKEHRTHVTPPLEGKGIYVVAASVREDFVDKKNQLTGVLFTVSRLVPTSVQTPPDSAALVVVRDGQTGAPVGEASVELWGFAWNVAAKLVEVQRTAADGVVRFKGGREASLQYFFVVRKDGDVTIDDNRFSFYPQRRSESDHALVYTDRSIYRPTQKLLWKVVSYHAATTGYPTARPGAALQVRLLDPNWQEVAQAQVTTNGFASASGEFTVPTGRLLGAWRVEVKAGGRSLGQAVVRVEEYKRPTFEVSFKDTGAPAKLNTPVTLTGEARYYFGLPVASGQVKWRVQRTPVYPWWWWWWGTPPARAQVVGSGVSALKADGTFTLGFTPQADPKLDKAVTYRYAIDADVTDEGGETRSAAKAIRLGQISVEATFAVEDGFFREGKPVSIGVRRTDLNGAPRAGAGSWRVVALLQPGAAVLPADEAPLRPPNAPKPEVVSAGDEVRPRHSPGYNPQATLRSWAAGAERAKGELTHDAQGKATIALPSLPAGAWRVLYETKDEFGSAWTMSTDVLVAGAGGLPVKLPAYLEAERTSVIAGDTARFLLGSAFAGQPVLVETFKAGALTDRRWLEAGKDGAVLERPVKPEDRGGFVLQVSVLRDWQLMQFQESIYVPWDDKELALEFSTFRDKLKPGGKETFRVTVKGKGGKLEAGAAEVLAYMYDQSLDLFGPHSTPSIPALYPRTAHGAYGRSALGVAHPAWLSHGNWYELPSYPSLREDSLKTLSGYGVGGLGLRGAGRGGGGYGDEGLALGALAEGDSTASPRRERQKEEVAKPAPAPPAQSLERKTLGGEPRGNKADGDDRSDQGGDEAQASQVPLRQNFAETAFFAPHLLIDAAGAAAIEFTVPDSVTAWNVWAHAVTKDLRGGSTKAVTRSVKDLMVRPYVPRFLRESDQAAVKVVVNNASKADLSGELLFDIIDPATQKSVAAEFGLTGSPLQPFTAKAGQGATLTFNLVAPKRVGEVAVKVQAKAGDTSDGELRPVPLLPSRMHLLQSRFVTLKDKDSRTVRFEDLAKDDDPTRLNEQLVVTVDAQLFYSVLNAMPYLVRYPYECTEQTLNRFVSTGIVSGVFRDHPAVASMAKKLSKRQTKYESFADADPNRKLSYEESPWLLQSRGGDTAADEDLINMLDPRNVAIERDAALAKLRKAQTPQGGFPWFPGGPPSPYITTYILHGLSRALEFKVDVPKDMVTRAWRFVADDYRRQVSWCMAHDACWETITFLNYVASAYPDESWLGGAFSAAERQQMLEFSFKHWRKHSPMLKGQLALTLKRMKRDADAKLVFDSVMDSAKTTQDDGTVWQPEDRAWLWYNDTIESHAFALRVLGELKPGDERRAGLVQWLLLNKKLGHWKSTRATAEVTYSLVKYLEAEKALGVREEANVAVGKLTKQWVFLPDEYTGRKNQLLIPGVELDPKTQSSITFSKATKGFQFASATWHFSTDRLPAEGRGDLFQVKRTYFKRVKLGDQVTLQPLADGAKLEPGDELEVQLSIRARQAAEYVHLRDPRGAGFEPEAAVSRYKYDLGLVRYEEYRDSATNFFFEALPAGEYTMKYRVRANMGGTFRVGPAVLQSMYAPEFAAYSAGHALSVATGGK